MPKKTLKNVKLKWCKFTTLDQYGKYSCQIDLNQEQYDQLVSWGLKPKRNAEDGSLFIRVRRDEDKGPVVVKDAALNTITATIANGAIANVMLDVYEYKRYGGGTACRIEKVQVLVWEAYGDDEDFEEVVDPIGGSDDSDGGDEEEGNRMF